MEGGSGGGSVIAGRLGLLGLDQVQTARDPEVGGRKGWTFAFWCTTVFWEVSTRWDSGQSRGSAVAR
jgi:hypothetical protein